MKGLASLQPTVAKGKKLPATVFPAELVEKVSSASVTSIQTQLAKLINSSTHAEQIVQCKKLGVWTLVSRHHFSLFPFPRFSSDTSDFCLQRIFIRYLPVVLTLFKRAFLSPTAIAML